MRSLPLNFDIATNISIFTLCTIVVFRINHYKLDIGNKVL